jgi:pyruvate/2-oxoglutarate dehydrogenase complex dihydrolipoamide acyltransferase (E2) component
MPALGQSSDELRLVGWLKSEGDDVAEGEPLFEVESDKTTLVVEAAVSGRLLKVMCEPQQVVRAGTVVAWLGRPGDAIPAPALEPSARASDPVTPPAMARLDLTGTGQRRPATPAARALARENGIDLATVLGTGPAGRIESRDVLAALQGRQRPGRD